MEAFGGELSSTGGKDFDESRAVAARIQRERGYHFVPSFHRDLVKGVATYAHELFLSGTADLDVVYVPIGMGSGICGLITVRDLLGLKTEIVGVVADKRAGLRAVVRTPAIRCRPIRRRHSPTGWRAAIRRPSALRHRQDRRRARRVASARMRSPRRSASTTRTTHNLAEGAGAAPLAALLQEKAPLRRQARRVSY